MFFLMFVHIGPVPDAPHFGAALETAAFVLYNKTIAGQWPGKNIYY